MSASVRITAPSRIHFGLLSLRSSENHPDERRFGGAGVMVDQPNTEIVVCKAEKTTVSGPLSERVHRFIELWAESTGIAPAVDCRVLSNSPEHVGLGLGTQLGLSLAWALDSLYGREDIELEERALSVGRGNRSAVGTYGFRDGGLIIDAGKTRHQSLGELRERIELPEDWCLLLARPEGRVGLAGQDEVTAFDTLPSVSDELHTILRRELHDRLVPAARSGDFETFAESVYQYGYSAGECFSANQGGPFTSPDIAEFVDYCRDVGVPGVGQSSWGPTVFGWFPHRAAAESFISNHLGNFANFQANAVVTSISRRGARRNFTVDVDVD